MIYISNNIYLAIKETTDSIRNKPIIGYHSVFIANGVQAPQFSVTAQNSLRNIWYPDTYTYFESEKAWTGSKYISFFNPTGEYINYVTLVKHNLATYGYAYSIEYFNGSEFVEIVSPRIPPNNNVIINYFDDILTTEIRVIFYNNSINSNRFLKITHAKVGRALFLQRRRFVGVKPYTMDVQYEGVENRSSNGNYLGSYVTSESQHWEIKQENNDPTYIREQIIPFIKHMNGVGDPMNGPPFTFVAAWRPDDYPSEILYCWKPLSMKVSPEIQRRNGMMQWEASGNGIK